MYNISIFYVILLSNKMERILFSCNMESGGHDTKQNKPDRKRQILWSQLYVESEGKEKKPKETIEWWLPGATGQRV